jgi:hypothetical protein
MIQVLFIIALVGLIVTFVDYPTLTISHILYYLVISCFFSRWLLSLLHLSFSFSRLLLLQEASQAREDVRPNYLVLYSPSVNDRAYLYLGLSEARWDSKAAPR